MMGERAELGFQNDKMRGAGSSAVKTMPAIKFQKMVEQTSDGLSFFNVFEKTCTLHCIQSQ